MIFEYFYFNNLVYDINDIYQTLKRMSRITRLCRRCMFDAGSGSTSRPPRHPLAAVSASSVGSLANHSLCNCEAVLRQYGGGRLLAQSITMRRVYQSDNQQMQLVLPCLRRPSKWELRSASLRMILRSGSVTFPRISPSVGDPTTSIAATSLSCKCLLARSEHDYELINVK